MVHFENFVILIKKFPVVVITLMQCRHFSENLSSKDNEIGNDVRNRLTLGRFAPKINDLQREHPIA